MIKIEKMTIDDYEQIYELWLNTKGMGLNNVDDFREGIAKYLLRNPETCFIASFGDQIIGVILSGHDGRRGYIHHLAVMEEFRRQGIGKALVQRCLEGLKGEGISKVAFVVFKRNKGGNRFWNKLGFSKRSDLVYRNKVISDEEIIRIDT